MDITVRCAAEADYAGILALIQDELGYPDTRPEAFYGRMEMMAADDKHAAYVAEICGEIVGFIGIHRGISYEAEGEYIRVIALAASKNHRRMGIGSLLLQTVEKEARERGITALVLSSSFRRTEAHAFYESNGWEKTSYTMKKDLPD